MAGAQRGERATERRWLGRRPTASGEPGLARAPQPVPPSSWVLPDPHEADEDGVVGVGADLAPGTLVDAYRRGIFPWPHPGVPLPWFSPDPRGVLPVDGFHVSRSLRRRLRTCGWTTTVDAAFGAVVAACGQDRGEAGTWITGTMARAYGRLHDLGWAHSLEVWSDGRLVGGIYGVQVGGVFTGESMFHRETDASKVALLDLARRLATAGGSLLDVQLTTAHLASLGARDVPRNAFLTELDRAGRRDVRLRCGELPVSRLLGA
ncbi:leucyl/phenylalanyl-tRNA--protein transferase [Egicoccus halophilus]|uniref:Leucyl/phenylalanyl-tRNA--protein transferase n=1 Tax=Egicoccus halophilus TaxID=1670830 RepID=A0A8J3ET94_9ACTN|nr:leucyl/phenylalanyl-tRNA--protein transferase [Egicoccus halophilus]GGI04749.1 leucyl/phenylalanyl-tRNA--protein transferase [Egicoccus halophilus]